MFNFLEDAIKAAQSESDKDGRYWYVLRWLNISGYTVVSGYSIDMVKGFPIMNPPKWKKVKRVMGYVSVRDC